MGNCCVNAAAANAAGTPAPKDGVGNALSLTDGVIGKEDLEVVASFPGKWQSEWNQMVSMVELMRVLDAERALFSTACIFLPPGDARYGKHDMNEVDKDGRCWCVRLYGSPQKWGCRWFSTWRSQLHKALDLGQRPVVVYKAEQCGEGDAANWKDLPLQGGADTERRGLGASQAGEVAYIKLVCKNGFARKDVRHAASDMLSKAYQEMRNIVRGPEVGERLARCLRGCRPAQRGLTYLALPSAELGETGMAALAAEIPACTVLKEVFLSDNGIGEGGATALAQAIAARTELEWLSLNGNSIGEGGATALAQALPACLSRLLLDGNGIGEGGVTALAQALPACEGLAELGLGNNGIGEGGVTALAQSLPACEALTHLGLVRNDLNAEGRLALEAAGRPGLEVEF